MMKTLSTFILVILSVYCYSQSKSNFNNTYPEGIYLSKEDFLKKVPNENTELIAKSIVPVSRKVIDTIPDQCMFFYKATDKKVNKAFAVSYKGNLYFQALAILKNREKTDRAQSTNYPASFSRVLIGGDNYLYTEIELANAWAQGTGYGIGGVAGGMLAANAIKGKGVVWDYKNSEFNIFKNCKDFNAFIADKYVNGVQDCGERQPDMLKVRAAMEIIK